MPTGIYGKNLSVENATQWLKMNPTAVNNKDLLKVADYNDDKKIEPSELAQAYNNDAVILDGVRSFKINPALQTPVNIAPPATKPSAQEEYYQRKVQEDKAKEKAAKVGAGVAVGVGAAVGIGWLFKTAVLDNLR